MEYTVHNLEYAVSVFYNGEQTDRAKAHSWLTEAQRVPEAWNFVWELLQPNKNTEVQFYAATTLHTKILRCWNEVPPESYDELKQKLLHAVITYSKGPKIVTNRLCISLAAFILQQGATDLASVLSPLSTTENTSLLLEVLTVIPEEYNSMTMGSVLRRKNRIALQQASTMVLDDMLRYLQTVYNDYTEPPSDEVVQSWLTAATCAGSWLTLGGEDSGEAASTTLAERAPLCRALFTAVHVLYTCNDCVCGLALEACEACLGAVRAAGAAGDAARHEHSAAQLLADLAALSAPLLAAHNVPNSMNEELLSAVITCCVAVAECHARVLVAGVQSDPPNTPARQLLELLLTAQAAPGHYPLHETRSNLVFGLWYTLQDEVLHMTKDGEKVHPVWKEVFSQLLLTLITKSETPLDHTLSQDDEELLRCYRQDIGDTVLYCCSILGEVCWHIVDEAISSAGRDERLEAALHVFQALADLSPTDSALECVLRTLEHAIHIANTSHNKRMLSTALDCLGSYAAWLGTVGGARAAALAAGGVRAAGGALSRAPAAAALALRKLCDDCAAPAAASALDIVRAAQSPEGRSDAWVRRQLIAAAGAALAAADPAAAQPALYDLARTLHNELSAQVEEVVGNSKDKCGAGRRAAAGVAGAEQAAKCAAALLTSLSARPELAGTLLRALLPSLVRMRHHAALTQPMFHILKQALAALMTDCLPLATEIAQLTATGFHTQPCPAGLEVVQLLVMFVGEEWAGAGQLLHECVVESARTVAADLGAAPDLVHALFSLLHTVTKKKNVQVALNAVDDLLPELIELACACISVPEAGVVGAACAWLAALAGRRADALQPHAPPLLHAVLRCIDGVRPRNQMEPLAALVLALNRAAWRGAVLADWLRPALATLPAPPATPAHRAAFLAAVLREKVSKRRVLDAMYEFSLACRGLIDTEYARQTLSSKQLVA